MGGQSDHKSHTGSVGERRSEAAGQKLKGTLCINKSKEWNDLAPGPNQIHLVRITHGGEECRSSHRRPSNRHSAAVQFLPFILLCAREDLPLISGLRKPQRRLKRRRGGDGASSLSHPTVSLTSGGPSAGQYIGNVSQSICFPSTHIVWLPFRYKSLIWNLIAS